MKLPIPNTQHPTPNTQYPIPIIQTKKSRPFGQLLFKLNYTVVYFLLLVLPPPDGRWAGAERGGAEER